MREPRSPGRPRRLSRRCLAAAGMPPPASARSRSLIFSPAATTAAACSRPGDRVSRSIGPDTEMAASTRARPPLRPRTGAETDATPASRSAALAAQPRRRTPASVVAVNFAPRSPRCIRSPSSQASSTWAADPAVIGSAAPTGTVSRSPLARSAAATQTRTSACRAVELGALPGHVPELDQHRLGDGEQPVLARRRGELGDPRAEHEPALHVPGEQPVPLEGDRDTVGGGPRQPGRLDQLGEGGRAALGGGQHANGFVQHADTARSFMY